MRKINKITAFFVCCFLCLSCQQSSITTEDNRVPSKRAFDYSLQSDELYQKAIEEYKKALESTDDEKKIYYDLGMLYYKHGDYPNALESLSHLENEEALKLTAICHYKAGQYTDALTIFNKLGEDIRDDEYLYYYALTCEQQNLYSQALKIYESIESQKFLSEVKQRMSRIGALADKTALDKLDPEIRDLIVNSPTQEDYPQAGAVVLFGKEDLIVNEDNTTEYIQHYLVKILNERGKSFGEVKVGYDSTYDKVDIDFARTIKPDGQVISVGSKHIRDVSRYLNFPLYSNARVRIISMPEVTIGSFIEYKVRHASGRMVAEDKFNSTYFLQFHEPVQYAKFTVTLPKRQQLHRRILNEEFNSIGADLEPKVFSDGKNQILVWEFRDVPKVIPELGMPPLVEVTPVVLLSTFQSWDQIYDWWWPLAQDKIQVNPEMKVKIKELIADKKTIKEKAQALYNFCAKDIRYVAVEYGQAGYEPHRAEEIFSNKYGDCKDQTILLISMLKEIGIEAYPVLIGTRGTVVFPDDFPTVAFNHCITAAQIEDKLIFLDPTGETVLFGDLPSGDQGRRVFVIFKDKGELITIPKSSSYHNRVVATTTLNFDEQENIKGERAVLTSGTYDQSQRYRFRYTMPILIEEGIKGRIQGIIPGSKLLGYEIENDDGMLEDIRLSYEFEGSDFLIKAGPKMRVVPQLGNVALGLVAKDERMYPIDYYLLKSKENIFKIKLPKQYRVISMPEPIVDESRWFDYETTYYYDEDTITFEERIVRKKERVEPEEYKDYKTLLERLSKDIRHCIILEKGK